MRSGTSLAASFSAWISKKNISLYSNRPFFFFFFAWPKNQDKYLTILGTKKAFKMK